MAKVKKAKKPKTTNQRSVKKSNYLGNVLAIQIGIILIGSIVMISAIHFINTAEMKRNILDKRLSILSETAQALMSESFDRTQAQLDKLTVNDDIHNAIILQDIVGIRDLENRFNNQFAHAKSLKIVPWGELGTAGIKRMGVDLRNNIETMMITQVANNNTGNPEVYKIDNEWLLSFAAPVIHQGNTIGVLLLSVTDKFLLSALSQPVFKSHGGLKVSQSKAHVFEVGSTQSKWQTTLEAPFDGGEITVSLAQQHAEKLDLDFLMIYVTAAALCLLFTATPFIGFILSQRALKHDTDAMLQYIKQSKGLHEGKQPELQLMTLDPLNQSIQQLVSEEGQQQSETITTAVPKVANTQTQSSAAAVNDLSEKSSETDDIGSFNAPQVFKEYDIRGLVSTELTEENVIAIGRAIGSEVMANGGDNIVIGFDARDSSHELADQLSAGIHSTGCHTISIGQALSPTLYFAAQKLTKGNGVMVTGSHLDDSYNGFKVVIEGQSLLGDQIQLLLQRIINNNFISGAGRSSAASVNNDYTQEIATDIITARGLTIIVDHSNQAAAELVSALLEENDCQVVELKSEETQNNEAMTTSIKQHNADFGISFDSDADRLIVTSNTGELVDGDKIIMLFGQDIASRNPGSSIVYDIKCSRELSGIITQAGSRPVMCKTGHSNIKAKIKEVDAIFAGELTGHFYFNDRWFGFDDAIYAAMRLAELISSSNDSLEQRLQALPQTSASPEYIIATSTHDKKHEIVDFIADAMASQQGEKITLDGFRIEFEAGWGLVRASNTSQAITLRFEAKNEEMLKKLQTLFKAGLSKADPDLDIPF